MIDKYLIVLFIKSILPNFYPEQILSAVRLTICPLRLKFVKLRQTIRTCKNVGGGTESCLNEQLSR